MKTIEALKKKLNKQFDMTDLGPCSQYLGMQMLELQPPHLGCIVVPEV